MMERNNLNIINLKTPISEDDARRLKVGDMVTLTGKKVYVIAMTNAAKIVLDSVDKGQPIFDLKDSVIYHCPCGFQKIDGSYRVRWVGATTSMMNEPVTPRLIELGARVIMGKGGMGEGTLHAMKRHGAVYLATVGAASAFLARGVSMVVKMIDPKIWLSELEVHNFGPAMVGMDSHGQNLFEKVMDNARKNLRPFIEQDVNKEVTK